MPHAEKKGLVQRLALVDHTLSRFNRELDNQEKQIRKLQVTVMYMPVVEHNHVLFHKTYAVQVNAGREG